MERKSLASIAWNVSEEEYRADSAYSYSTIAKFDREGFEKLDTLFDKVESPSLLFGSCTDTLLTDGQEAFDERFFVADFPEVTDAVKKIVDILFDMYSSTYSNMDLMPNSAIIPVIDEQAYQTNWKPETRCKVVKEKGCEYYGLKFLAKDKTLVSTQMYQDVIDCVEALRTSEATKWYFEADNPFDNNIERLYQLKFKGEYDGIPLRCMADLIIVDHKNKIIYPTDLKTSYKEEWNFFKSFIEWKYFHQSNLYAEIIRQNIIKDEYFKDFKIADYRFIVICNRTRQPLVWEWPYTKTECDFQIGSIKFPNWRGIVKQLDYYLKEQPSTPEGITTEDTNNLATWILKEYGSN